MLKTLLFDFDGTIADSEPLHFKAHKHALKEIGIKLSVEEYQQRGMNKNSAVFYNRMADGKNIDIKMLKDSKKRFFDARLQEIDMFQGVKEFLEAVSGKYKLAVVTAAPSSYVKEVLEHKGLLKLFDLIVSGGDIGSNKPSPDPYLEAMKSLSVDSSECIAFEDTKQGIDSAKGANIFCVAIRKDSFGNEYDFPEADVSVDSWQDIDGENLSNWI